MAPPPNAPPPGTPGEEDDPTRVFRFDISAEIAQPRGPIEERQGQAKAIRIGWFGANPSKYFAIGGSFRFVSTEPKNNVTGQSVDRTELFMDLVGLYLRFTIPVAPQLALFVEADPSLTGLHIPCTMETVVCNEEGFEFVPRFGLTGRAGGIYSVIPNRLDLVGYAAYEEVFLDQGGWFSIGVGITVHYGPSLGEMKRRQMWQQQQMQMQWQQQQPQQPPPRTNPPPPPPPPTPTTAPPTPPPPPDPYRS